MKKVVKKVVTKAATKKAVKKTAKKVVKKVEPKATEVLPNPLDGAREIVYPEVEVRLMVNQYNHYELSIDEAKELLGWQEEPEDGKFGDDYDLLDLHNKKIRLLNNFRNRPYLLNLAKSYAQSILKKLWKCNGETLVIGKTGMVISGQHRLTSLILAAQEHALFPEKYPAWEASEELTLPCLIVFGVEESDDVVNTIDTGKPRSLSDVIYRSEYFADKSPKHRKALARITDYAVRMLWSRTGAGEDAFTTKRSHQDSLDFIFRHPKILQAVNYVFEEDAEDNKLSKYLSLGYLAGLLFLMSAGRTKPEDYYQTPAMTRTDDLIEWSLYDDACEFLTLLAGGEKGITPVVKDALLSIESPSLNERTAILVKAWMTYMASKPIKLEHLKLKYDVDPETGIGRLVECPTVGGIDKGASSESLAVSPSGEPPEEQVSSTEAQPSKTSVWILGPGRHQEEMWVGYVKEGAGDGKHVIAVIGQGFAGEGKEQKVPLNWVHKTKPVFPSSDE